MPPSAADTANLTAIASAFLTSLAKELTQGEVNLPSFPKVVVQVQRVFEDPDSTAEQLVRVIGSEPMLAAKVLALSNSAAFVRPGRPVTDLRNAVTRLGQQTVMSTVMAFAMHQLQHAETLKPIAGDLAKLWKHSVTVAALCQILAARTKLNRDEAFFTGLVSRIGQLYILARSNAEPRLAHNPALLDLVASWHPAIGKSVLENWKFAESTANAVGAQLEYDRERHTTDMTDVLVASVELTTLFKGSRPCNFQLEGISAFKSLDLSADDCVELLERADVEVEDLQHALGF